MKLFDSFLQKNIICPNCGGEEFTDFVPSRTTTYLIYCKNENCTYKDDPKKQRSDLLIPVKQLNKSIVIIQS